MSAFCARCGRRYGPVDVFGGDLCPQCKSSVRYDGRGGRRGNIIDSVSRKILFPLLLPILVISFVIAFITRYFLYVVSIAVIVIACLFICKSFRRKGKNPALVILISIGLILGVFYIVPQLENGSIQLPAVFHNQASPAQARYMLVNSDALNVRRGPSTDHTVVGQLAKNTRVQVLNSSGQWWRIRSGNIEGYVNSRFLINEERVPYAPTSFSEPGMGTTRAPSFQRAYEEAVSEYDRTHSGVPSGLVLPGGQTVGERIQSGRVSGK